MASPTTDRRFGVLSSLAIKAPVTVAATGALTLSGEQTIDGVAVKAINAAGRPDRVLALFQADTTQNGIYDVATGPWTRSLDANDNLDLAKGSLVMAASGGQAGQFWRCAATDPVQPGTSAMPWNVALAAATAPVVATITALKALDKTSNTRAFVTGYYAAGDGGGGLYWYDSTDVVTADNGGSVIVATDGGRWKLQLLGRVSLKQFGAKGDGATNDLTAIQNAHAAFADVFWPNGTYTIGNNTWTPPAAFAIYGESQRGVKLTRTGAGAIITTPINCYDARIENINFTGTGNTGITVAGTAGTLQGYLIALHLEHCDFDYDLAYGINADLIFGRIEKCNFGVRGVAAAPTPGTSTFVALRSAFYPATVNYANLNVVRECLFHYGGNTAQATVQLQTGTEWRFEGCDWEHGGMAVDARDVHLLQFAGNCWFEGNTNAAGALIRLDAGTATSRTTFQHCNFTNNTVDRIFQVTTGFAPSLRVQDCIFSLQVGTGFVLYDNNTAAYTLPGDGSVAFYDNTVSNGNAGNKLKTVTSFRGGSVSPRVVAIVDTTGAGSIVYCNDPNISLTRNGTGDVSLSGSSMPLGTLATKVMVKVSPQTASQHRYAVSDTATFRVQLFNGAGVAVDGIYTAEVGGA